MGGGGGSAVASGKPARQKRKSAKKAAKRTKSGKPRKNPWANLTPKEHLARVNAIRKGRGLPPKRKL